MSDGTAGATVRLTVFKVDGEQIASDKVNLTAEEYTRFIESIRNLTQLTCFMLTCQGDAVVVNPQRIDSMRIEIFDEDEEGDDS